MSYAKLCDHKLQRDIVPQKLTKIVIFYKNVFFKILTLKTDQFYHRLVISSDSAVIASSRTEEQTAEKDGATTFCISTLTTTTLNILKNITVSMTHNAVL